MRVASLALALLLPLTPFLTLQFLAKYPSIIAYVGLVVVALVGVVGLVRGRGVGYAGLASALISSLLVVLSMGYIPYLTHFTLGTIKPSTLPYLGVSIAASLYAHFLGNAYEASKRFEAAMRRYGHDPREVRELDAMNAWAIAVGGVLLAVSLALYALMRVATVLELPPMLVLAVFIVVYLALMAIAMVHSATIRGKA